ncbi:MAG: HRDC domain-containing protein [Candidatus Saccharibacteria bacterium]|nr:HRDC domain-containing protein [Moraxellaceae bacterium]
MFEYLTEQDQLGALFAEMAHTDSYALDTEFIKTNTLWPYLGLLQINVNDKIYVLDGQTLDLNDLWLLVFNARQNIFHACGEDLDLIHYYSKQKPLDNIFDTQVGLSFLGFGLQMGYQQALDQILGIQIDKGETRSDWLARPLRPEQLHYAANDVVHLPELARQIQRDLNDRGLLEAALEDCMNYARDVATDTVMSDIYMDVGTFRHTRKQLAQLQQLCVWREQIAYATNQPRSFILKNSTMLDLVDQQPTSQFQFNKIKDLKPSIMREHGKTILDLIHYLPEESQWPMRIHRTYRQRNTDLTDQISAFTAQISVETQVPVDVLLRKKWLSALFSHIAKDGSEADLPRNLLGWRYEVLTRPILGLLSHHKDIIAVEMAPIPHE